ncbi:IS607 family transposase [Scytonema sp. HK-05]|uniref:IS607 family transposase n=1 Tax=Scytonema sp. HK-05 TaxID=1137095 RepID=UPI000937C907|nr:IS607 family transposase [Scytonema sp. HK-05]OKH46059.1 DNA invertase [Scytonema sp. HK-05]
MTNGYRSPVAASRLGISTKTLQRWENGGKIEAHRTEGNHRRFKASAIDALLGIEPTDDRKTILYARVSSRGQKDDLDSQVNYLVSKYPGCEVIRDIGSGLNFRRKGLLTLLERILSGDVKLVVVSNKDRLCRFGFDHYTWLASKFSCEILVLNNNNLSPEREMVEDILAIIHVFSCRLYGLRKYKKAVKEDPDLSSVST